VQIILGGKQGKILFSMAARMYIAWLLAAIEFFNPCENVRNVSSREMWAIVRALNKEHRAIPFVIARAAVRKIASPHSSLCSRTMRGQQNTPGSLTALWDNKRRGFVVKLSMIFPSKYP
jgi:hypothetical protein